MILFDFIYLLKKLFRRRVMMALGIVEYPHRMINPPSNQALLELRKDWIRHGKPVPAPWFVKHEILLKYAEKYKTQVLVETGTYLGETVIQMKKYFSEIHSVELDKRLFESLKRLFKGEENIFLYQGNSIDYLEQIILGLKLKPLFWLDAHYSGLGTAKGDENTPIMRELAVIMSLVKKPVVLIDDARLFTGATETGNPDTGYPELESLREYIKTEYPESTFSVKDDIIRISPKN